MQACLPSYDAAAILFTLIQDVLQSQSQPDLWTQCRLHVFSDGMQNAATASGEGRRGSPLVPSTTLAAYATAFAAELDAAERMVVQLQDALAAQSCAGPADAADVNLAALEYASRVAFSPTKF